MAVQIRPGPIAQSKLFSWGCNCNHGSSVNFFLGDVIAITVALAQCFKKVRSICDTALLAQWLERAAVNRKVTGSIPVGSVIIVN